MKVKKLNTKKAGVLHPDLAGLIDNIKECGEDTLSQRLRELLPHNTPWQYPRGDMHHWVPVLDKFDAVLEKKIKEYDVSNVQVKEFNDEDKVLLLEILRVEKLIMDNATSRKIFASYDRLSDLMSTSDLDVLQSVLNLVHRPAQQYSAVSSFELSENAEVQGKLLLLATAGGDWGRLKEHGWGLVKLAQTVSTKGESDKSECVISLPDSFFNVHAQFYRPTQISASGEPQTSPETPDTKQLLQPTSELRLGSQEQSPSTPSAEDTSDRAANVFETPTKRSASSSGLPKGRLAALANAEPSSPQQAQPGSASGTGTVTKTAWSHAYTNQDGLTKLSLFSSAFADLARSGKYTPHQVLAELLKEHPELQGSDMKDVHFEILSRLQCMLAVATPDGRLSVVDRERIVKVLTIRLTALAIYFHIVREDVAQTDLFLHEPTIISQLAQLIQPSSKVDDSIVTAAILTDDACLRYRSKVTEVFSSLNANVAHGILLTFFRDLIKRLAANEDVPYPLVDATLSLLSLAVVAPSHGNMLVGAGIIPTLIELIKDTNPEHGGYVARAIGLVDTIIYSGHNVFGIFVNAGGLDMLNSRITLELDRWLAPSAMEESITESELQRRTVPLKLMFRSIHRLMQSGGTAEGLRNLIDSELPKSLLRTLHNANKLGAPVLAIAINITATFVHNEPTSLPVIQELKLPEAMYDALENNKYPSYEVISTIPYALGALCLNQVGMDYALSRPELIRLLINSPRNPAYRDVLKERDNAAYLGSSLDELVRHHPALKTVLHEAIFSMLRDLASMGQQGRWANIAKIADYKLVLDAAQVGSSLTEDMKEWIDLQEPSDGDERNMDIVLWLSSQLLSGLFHNPHLAKDFLAQGGLQLVLDLYRLPCLVTQFATTDTANHFAEVFRNLAEADLPKVLEGIVAAVKEVMLDIPALEWHNVGVDTAASTRMLHPGSPDDLEKANTEFRKIVHLNNVLGLLSSLYSTIGFTHGKVATTFLLALGAFDGTPFIAKLGTLHRASIWQNIWLKAKQSPALVKPHAITQSQTFEETILSPSVEFSASELENTTQSTPAPAPPKAENNPIDASAQSGTSTVSQNPLPENYISLQYLFTRIPLQLTSFFQGVVKMLLFRRVEPVHKVQAVPTANCLADMLVEHLKLHDQSAASAIDVASKAAIMSLVSLLLFDGWTTTLSVNTMLLIAFEKKGGITAIKRLLVQHVDSLGSEPLRQSSRFQQDKAGLLRLLASLKVTFDLVKTLVSASPLCESPQTVILATKDKEPDHEEYFSPYEFLIKLRLELAEPIWKAFSSVWLVDCPVTFVKTITKSALTLVEPVPSPAATPGSVAPTSSSNTLSSTLAGLGFPTSRAGASVSASEVRPDPYYADMLVEMGFSRYAADLSLQRTNNVLPSATHYIVQHGHQLVVPSVTMSVDGTSAACSSGNVDDSSDVAESDGATSLLVTAASASPSNRAKAIIEGRKCHLEQRRKIYRQDLPARALQISEVHNDLVFDFAHTLLENPASIAAIIDAISEVNNVDPLRDAKLQARLRLFVVVAHQPAFGPKLNVVKCSELMETLRKLIPSLVSPRPAWVPALLLAVDCLLMWGEGVKPSVDGETQIDIVAGPRYEPARAEILSLATSLLAQPDLHEHELLAILRTLVFLTRDRSLLQPFLEKTGLPGLFQAVLATSTKRRHTAMALATIICRHLIEDEAVLQRCMEREIQQWFARPPRNSSPATIKLFVSNLRPAVLRDPSTFLKVAANELKLAEAEPRGGFHHVGLKDKKPSSNEIAAGEAEATTVTQPIDSYQMQIDDPFQALPETTGTAGSPLEQVMGYLINEVFSIHKAQIAKPAEAETKVDVKQSAENQLSAILLVMTELLGSYNESKISMLQPSKKMGKDAVGGNKMRSPVLQILLNHYVCNIVFDADVTRSSGDKVTDSQKARMNISNWAGAVIVALCSDASGPGAPKNAPSSIVAIRKTVMDTVAKAIKEVGTATDPLNLRYGRLWALSELCYRLLTARSSVQPRHHDDSSLHIAKIMLEKGFVPLLTNAMAEVDLTYPQVKNLITAVVQPLEYLTKISMKMARPDKPKPATDDTSEDESMSSGTESEDEDMEDEEGSTDAPDMYRNSSLGMFGGEMDDYLDDSDDMGDEDDEDDLDHYEEVEGMDDESENGTEPSESESESDEELEHWDAHMEDADGVDGDEVFANEDEDDHDHDGDEQFDMFDEDGVEPIDQENDDDGYGGEEVYLEDDMDEEEHSESDYDEEELNALDTVVVDPLSANSNTGGAANWGWGQPVRTQSRDDTHQQHRAHRGLHHTTMSLMDDIAPFRRSHTPQAPLSSIVSHPLLQQETGPIAHPHVPRSRGHRHYPGGPLGEILHSIEQLMGGSDDSARTLDNIMEQMGGRAPEMVRIEYMGAGGNGGALEIPMPRGAQLGHPRRGREPASVEPEAFSSMPLPTLNRWQEEETLLAAYDPTTRLNNLTNHLVQALLPAAKEDQRKRSEREAEAKQAIEAKLEQQRVENEASEERLRVQKEAEEAERRAQEPPVVQDEAAITNARDVEMGEVESGTAAQTSSAASTERIIVTIHGAEVDITDTGIDPEFLEALPEDMRADVVQQHLREHRLAETPQQPATSTEISPEFLDALPPEIRAEVIQQEAMEAARRNAESRAGAAPGGSAARVPQMFAGMPEMADIQEFLSTLDPGLAGAIMQGGMPGFGQQAVGGQAQDSMQALHQGMARIASSAGGASRQPQRGVQAEALQKKVAPRESIQLLEKSGIAALVRLLFFPDINKKDRLLKVLGNLCENSRSRSDVVNLLLSVLQDDSGDLSYVDKQTVAKPLKGATTTPKATPKKKTTAENSTSSAVMLAGLQSDSIPAFVAQRAFEALAHIAANNEQVLVYFLTEHELPVSGAKYSKKGKSKDRQSTSTYPITVLLKLLDRETLFRSPGMADTLTALLASLTKPLASIASAESATDATPDAQNQIPAHAQEAAGESEPAPVRVEQSPTQSTAPPTGVESNFSGDILVKTGEVAAEESTTTLKVAPSISEEILRMVPSILTHGECSSRTFSSTLGLIQNLTHIPGAKEIISSQLQDQAQRLGDSLRIDLEQLHQGLLQAEGSGSEVSVASFTPASSAQTKLLRVLKTIDYIYAPKDGQNHITWDASAITSIAEGTKSLTVEEEKVEGIFQAMHFTPLWDTLGSCLSVVERKDSMINIATVLLPLVESLMVVSKYGSAKAAASRSRIPSAALSPMSPKNAPDEEPFVMFTSRHRKVLNTMVRNNPSLMSGSFSLLILNPRVLEFDNKRNWFMQQLRKKPNRDVGGHIHLNIRRDDVFVDSYRALSNKSGETLKYGKLNIKFAGEEGVDAGGVTREWYSVLAQSIFNPGYCLFEPCAADEGTYQLSQHSWVNEYAQDYFKFIGKIIGKAIYDQRLLDAYFSRAFYKQILGRKVDVRDLESVDPEYHKSLLWMLNNDITGIIELDFSLETEEFGAKKIIDLKEGGSNIPVTEDNKEEYVRLVVEHRLETSIQKQASAFLAGFYEVIPRKLISVFDPDQLELLISGVSQIDVDELKNATQLHGWKHSDAEITWFWRALRSFSQEEKAKFLMFVTSSSRVPLGGFTQLQGSSGIQPFQIHKLYRENVLPSSATCFNELLLPSYPSYEDLRHKLLTAISEGAGHFGHA